jgi:hypothetical protein
LTIDYPSGATEPGPVEAQHSSLHALVLVLLVSSFCAGVSSSAGPLRWEECCSNHKTKKIIFSLRGKSEVKVRAMEVESWCWGGGVVREVSEVHRTFPERTRSPTGQVIARFAPVLFFVN